MPVPCDLPIIARSAGHVARIRQSPQHDGIALRIDARQGRQFFNVDLKLLMKPLRDIGPKQCGNHESRQDEANRYPHKGTGYESKSQAVEETVHRSNRYPKPRIVVIADLPILRRSRPM